jgi:adenylosuccinate synthase
MANVVIVGTQWGDEGKGKIVDILAEFADLIVRFQGGSNAGHTLVVGGEKVVTHLVPSGIMHPGKRCVIGASVVVDPEVLVAELDLLQQRGVMLDASSLAISDRAHVVMPYHKILDAARESAKGTGKIGTTQRGIGPCLEDKMSRTGLRMGDLMDPAVVAQKLAARLPELNALLVHYGRDPIQEKDILPKLSAQTLRLAPFITDVGVLIRQEMDRSRNVLFEGAQGTLLDVDHGTYPFVTSSNTLAGSACVGLGFGPNRINSIVGVCKAYTTRVGEGPFPTELKDERGRHLQQKGAEFGATTGRARRCGWLDLAAIRHAVALNGCTSLCLTKLDVLGGIGPIRVAIGYKLDGREIETLPGDIRAVSRLEPIYEECDGWEEDINGVREKEALPQSTSRFLARIEALIQLPIDMISVGPGRAETIIIRNPFRRRN